MWVGGGFDTDGDGDKDVFFVQKLTPAQQKANAEAMGCVLGIGLLVAAVVGAYFAVEAALIWWSNWWQANSATVISWTGQIAFWGIATLIVTVALGVLFIGISEQRSQVSALSAVATAGPIAQSAKPRRGPSKPCPRCGTAVVESYLACPSCKLPCPYDATTPKVAVAELFSPSFCIVACGILAAVDGRLTSEEVGVVASDLANGGVSGEKLRERLLDACRKIHAEGIDGSLKRLGDLRRGGKCFTSQNGVAADRLIALLETLGEKCGGDAARKKMVLDRLVTIVRGVS